MKPTKELLAFKAAMRDMREEKISTIVFQQVRDWENRIRPSEISDKQLNGQPIF